MDDTDQRRLLLDRCQPLLQLLGADLEDVPLLALAQQAAGRLHHLGRLTHLLLDLRVRVRVLELLCLTLDRLLQCRVVALHRLQLHAAPHALAVRTRRSDTSWRSLLDSRSTVSGASPRADEADSTAALRKSQTHWSPRPRPSTDRRSAPSGSGGPIMKTPRLPARGSRILRVVRHRRASGPAAAQTRPCT